MCYYAFFRSQFSYCPLVWMRHSRNLSNKINRLHERHLRIVYNNSRSSHPEVFLGKCVLRICSKFAGKHPCRSAISIKLQRDPKKNSTSVMELHPNRPLSKLFQNSIENLFCSTSEQIF